MLPPGRLRLATNPGAIGSPPIANTMGVVVVAAFAASAAGVPLIAAVTATLRRTRSADRAGKRWKSPSAQRYSMAMLRPFDETRCTETLTECGHNEVRVARRQTAEEA